MRFENIQRQQNCSSPNTSSISARTRCTFSSPICTKIGAALGQQVAGHGEAVAQVGQVGVDAVAPGVAEGLDLLGLAGDVVGLAVRTSRLVVDHWKLELNLMP